MEENISANCDKTTAPLGLQDQKVLKKNDKVSSEKEATETSRKKNKAASKDKSKNRRGKHSQKPPKLNSEFVFNDITSNPEASNLIKDLVKCFTSNSALPAAESEKLYERTVAVFLYVLNCCIQKILLKLGDNNAITSGSQNNVKKKDVGCQTDISNHKNKKKERKKSETNSGGIK